jgi:SAM-dependent methyltransferase
MRNLGVYEINKLNQEFYKKHEESFSRSRDMNFWEGFKESIKFITPSTAILDLGCGNARFLEFLLQKNISFKDYTGVDSSKGFIDQNIIKYPQGNFHTQDILEYENFLNLPKSNFILVYGVTHHLPSKEFRKNWFEKLQNLVEDNGVLVLSFWNFDFKKSVDFTPSDYKLEDNDYFLGWRGDFSTLRFCHFYDNKEIEEIKEILNRFYILKEFDSDSNHYIILKKKHFEKN